MTSTNTKPLPFGSEDLQLPEELRGQLRDHIQDLRTRFLARGWGKRVGFGERPALVVIDLARYWVDPTIHIGANVDSIIEATCRVLAAARSADIPIFFTTWGHDPDRKSTRLNSSHW